MLLIPLALIELWRRGGARAVAKGAGAAAAVLAAVFGPFAIIAPHGVTWALHVETARALEVESVGASFFAFAHALFGVHLHIVLTSGGSHGIAGPGARTVSTLLAVAMVAALAAAYVRYFRACARARGPGRRRGDGRCRLHRVLEGVLAAIPRSGSFRSCC